MTGTKLVITYGITALVFFAVDLFWLGVIAKNLYAKYLGHLMAEQVNWVAALIFYALYIVGIILFAVDPGVRSDSLARAVVWGVLFGFFTYATYDLTNLATLKGWPVTIVFIDIAWGMILCGIVSAAGFWAATRLS
jgi:uncharacterized membrane protein